jgi:hypothetical protein
VVNGLGIFLLLKRSGWNKDAIKCTFWDGMHVQRWHINMAHEDNLSMIEEIQVWRMPPSLIWSVGYFQLRLVIIHKKVQEDPSIPLQESPGREISPTGN